jgi:hypothetical protein
VGVRWRIRSPCTISAITPEEARQAISQLHIALYNITKKDQEQEVRGIALPVLDAVLSAVRGSLLDGDPVLATLPDLISPEAIEAGEPIRAVDALLVVGQLENALDRAISARPKNEGTARLI